MAETTKHRSKILDLIYELSNDKIILLRDIIDIGSGDDPLLSGCDKFDLPVPYTEKCDKKLLTYVGDARHLTEVVKKKYKVVYSSHLLEDFNEDETIPVLKEWIKIIKNDGLLIILCPDQQRYLEHCQRCEGKPNEHHRIDRFSLEYIKSCLAKIPEINFLFGEELFDDGEYNFLCIAHKS
ncbi:MAG: hypothetical protein AB2L12_08745 [Smithellaceae bacterium]